MSFFRRWGGGCVGPPPGVCGVRPGYTTSAIQHDTTTLHYVILYHYYTILYYELFVT